MVKFAGYSSGFGENCLHKMGYRPIEKVSLNSAAEVQIDHRDKNGHLKGKCAVDNFKFHTLRAKDPNYSPCHEPEEISIASS